MRNTFCNKSNSFLKYKMLMKFTPRNECYRQENFFGVQTILEESQMITEQDLWISKSFLVLIGSFMFFSLIGVL